MGLLFSIILYIAVLVFFAGTARKLWRYSRIPAPLKIPTTPAPTTRTGVVLRLAREVVLFESLFKATRWTWLFGWLFHAGLFVVLLAHLRYFTQPVWWWVELIAPLSPYAGIAMLVGLAGLLIRRFAVARVRYISAPSDYLMLVLLLVLAGSGIAMRLFWHTDIIAVKQFATGLWQFDFAQLPGHALLLLHLLMVAVLLLIFPFSKLLHAPGLFFSPSRNQADNSRERRHVNPWADSAQRGDPRG